MSQKIFSITIEFLFSKKNHFFIKKIFMYIYLENTNKLQTNRNKDHEYYEYNTSNMYR